MSLTHSQCPIIIHLGLSSNNLFKAFFFFLAYLCFQPVLPEGVRNSLIL